MSYPYRPFFLGEDNDKDARLFGGDLRTLV
jgi:hypothetical protein